MDRRGDVITLLVGSTGAQSLDQTGTQWSPALEWTLTCPTVEIKPFDVEA